MNKTEAIALLGGTTTAAAKAIGISAAAVSLWPEQLPPRIADRVQAALYRQGAKDAKAASRAKRTTKVEA